MDLAKVFARVNHDTVMRAVATRGQGGRVWPLLPRVLTAGARAHEARHEPGEGGPPGGPRAPLRSNRSRDRLEREFARRGHRVVRDAADRPVDVRSTRASSRV
jgi:retron-type reverse transcriptase